MRATSKRQLFLEREAAQLRERLGRIDHDRRRGQGALDPDFSEQAVECQNDQVLDQLELAVAAEIRQIDHALDHLSQGRGDLCEDCGKPIGERRLAALPYATQCTACAGISTTHPA